MALATDPIHIGAGFIYVDATAPATGTPHPSLMPHTAGVPTTGHLVGHTSGGATFTYTPTKADIKSDQVMGVIGSYLTEEVCQLEFSIMQRDFQAMVAAFDAIGAIQDSAKMLFHAGGIYQIADRTVVLVSKQRQDPTLFEVLTIYKAQSMEPVTIGFTRTDVSLIKVTLRGVHDDSRDDGDMMFQYYRELS